jgi:hypothetical protein
MHSIVTIDQLRGDTNPLARLTHAAFEQKLHAKLTSGLLQLDRLPLVGENRVPAHDGQRRDFGRSVMMSSVMPSEKSSCSGSPLMFLKGSTAIDGFPAEAEPVVAVAGSGWTGGVSIATLYTRTGCSMFFNACSPICSKARSSRITDLVSHHSGHGDAAWRRH